MIRFHLQIKGPHCITKSKRQHFNVVKLLTLHKRRYLLSDTHIGLECQYLPKVTNTGGRRNCHMSAVHPHVDDGITWIDIPNQVTLKFLFVENPAPVTLAMYVKVGVAQHANTEVA